MTSTIVAGIDGGQSSTVAVLMDARGTVLGRGTAGPSDHVDEPATSQRAAEARPILERVRIESIFGKMTVLVTNGQLVYPYGRETTGYEVANLADTLKKAVASGAVVLVTPYTSDGRLAAMVQFPGGYVAEIHATVQ